MADRKQNVDDPIAMPIYSGLLGYAIGISGSLASLQRQGLVTCAVFGVLLVAGSVLAFSYMAYQLHVGMSGEPSDFPFLLFFCVGTVLVVPVALVPYQKLKAICKSRDG
ncbi:MAG: hypothetical protein HYV60_03535 [Planctomycetia bacterium]|nr:hypothetical protein [Planctomycetia bacterium]